MKRKILIFLVVCLALVLTCWGLQKPKFSKVGWGQDAVTVMTRNIYVGTDLDKVMAAETPEEIPLLVAEAFQMLQSTNFPERAQALAKEIACWRPHLVGLQEISLIRYQSPGDAVYGGTTPAEYVLFDYLEILLGVLNACGMDYKVAGMIQDTDIEVPMIVSVDPLAFDDVRLTDYDVILARHDVETSRVVAANYEARLSLPDFGIDILRGYVAVDAKVGQKTYRFVNTHLEPVTIPEILPIQLAQAQELIATLQNETLPVILVGDFNSPAPDGPTYNLIKHMGYVDAWTRNLIPFNRDGFTAGQDLDLRNEESKLDERIDLIFVRSNIWFHHWQIIGPVFAFVVGDEQKDKTPSGLWPSDHAGVVAWLRIPVWR